MFNFLMQSQNIPALIQRLWRHLSSRRRKQIFLLLMLMIMVSLVEIVSIGSILPFLAVLTSPDKVFNHKFAIPIVRWLNLSDPKDLLLPFTTAFCAAAVLSASVRLLLVWVQTKLSYSIGADIALNVYKRTLHQPYSVHIARNSSEIINGVYGKAFGISSYVIIPSLVIASTTILLIAILATLLTIEPVATLSGVVSLGLIYSFVVKFSHRRLFNNSRQIADQAGNVIRSLQDGLGGIRDVLINHSQNIYCEAFAKANKLLCNAQSQTALISQSPRYTVEAVGILTIAILAYNLAVRDQGLSMAIPLLGALALGAQRLLPLMQQAFQAWAAIRGNQASFVDTLELLDQPMNIYESSDNSKLLFEHSIRFNAVSFKYQSGSVNVLSDLELVIPKGSRVGFIGATGSGKSTLLDLLLGLLTPTEGSLEVDGTPIDASNCRAWQSRIAHVPQSIFLTDSTVTSNIAFGVSPEKIDQSKVRSSAARAQILDFIESLPQGFDTELGERGVRFSGGQRQRIGIARALYKRADLIIFDEATSALDNETESAVMEAINSLSQDLTILIVAHRLTTLKNCDLIVQLDTGRISRTGPYQELVNS